MFDFFPKDYLLVIDESHATVPQIGGMYEGDRSRKTVLVEHGFRLPSALDNRPLNFEEFQAHAEPDDLRQRHAGPQGIGMVAAGRVVEADRPSHRPGGSERSRRQAAAGQIDDLIDECRRRADAKERMLVTTLTKRTAEELTDYLRDIGINVQYLHSEIDAIERVEILRVAAQRRIRRAGRHQPAARRAGFAGGFAGGDSRRGQGRVSAQRDELDPDRRPRRAPSPRRGDPLCRREDAKHPKVSRGFGISPQETARIQSGAQHHAAQRQPRRRGKSVRLTGRPTRQAQAVFNDAGVDIDIDETIRELEEEMLAAANNLEFEKAALLRDQIRELRRALDGSKPAAETRIAKPVTYRKSSRRPARSRR